MAKYKKRKDGRYMTHVQIGTDDSGKMKRKTLYGRTIRELEEKVAETRKQVAQGILILNDSLLLSKWAIEWLETYKNNTPYNTKAQYKNALKAHIIPALGDLKLSDIRAHHIQKLINEKNSEGHLRTAQVIFLTINQIMKKAVNSNLIARNPAETVEMPPNVKPQKRALTDIEKSYIEAANLNLKSRVFVSVLLYAGLRRGEALALTKNDIDLKENTITVDKTLIIKGNQAEIKPEPKSKAGFRTIPMPTILSTLMAEYIQTLDTIHLFPAAKSGTIMSVGSFTWFWEKIIAEINKAAGGTKTIKIIASDITPHIFRHTYATTLYYAGVDIKTAQYLLGHSSAAITMEIYTHLNMDKPKQAVGKLNDYFSSSQKVVSGEK